MIKETIKKLVADILEIMYSENINIISQKGSQKQGSMANPFNEVNSVAVNVAFESDDDYAAKYICMRIVPKSDGVQRIIFTDDKNRFAVLEQGMDLDEINKELVNHLNICDNREVVSLTDKASKVMMYYTRRELCQV